MRILFMTDRYPPHYDGGYEINCAASAAAMQKRGHETYVLTSMYGVDRPVVEDGVYRVMHTLGRDEGHGLPRRFRHLVNAFMGRMNYGIALKVIREVRPDVAFVWRMGHVSIFPVKAASDSGLPTVYRLGDRWLSEFRSKCLSNASRVKGRYRSGMFGGYLLNSMDFSNMISISEALVRDYEDAGFHPANLKIIPPGIPDGRLKEGPPSRERMVGDEIRLLYAGRLTEEKGVHVAVDAVWKLTSRLAPRKVSFDIVGGGPAPYIESLEDSIYKRGIGSSVRIMGQVPQMRLIESFPEYDALLFPSLWEEPFGMMVIEAMSRGLPVVASGVGGVPEIIEHMRNGMLVPKGDPDAIADAVETLAADPELVARMSCDAIRTVLERYTNERVMEQTEHYLLGLFEKHKAANGRDAVSGEGGEYADRAGLAA